MVDSWKKNKNKQKHKTVKYKKVVTEIMKYIILFRAVVFCGWAGQNFVLKIKFCLHFSPNLDYLLPEIVNHIAGNFSQASQGSLGPMEPGSYM